ncbi:MAG: hypothetical protein IJK77_03065 [Lachnospiraceae bacterium]|nr:hypothetical protein [Lachnospiraceae bacterium]
MIDKMKTVCVVSSASRKEEMLAALRDLGILHLSEKKSASRETAERFASLTKALTALSEFKPEKGEEKAPKAEILSDEEFEKVFRDVLDSLERRAQLAQARGAAATETDRIRAWGEFSPEEVKALAEQGYDLHFYRMGKKEMQAVLNAEGVRYIRLAPVDKMETVAVIGKLPPEISATEFLLPEKGLSELQEEIKACEEGIAECDRTVKEAAAYTESFKAQLLKAQNAENWSAASATAENDADLVWISGYIPEEEISRFKEAAAKEKWGFVIDDVAEDDEKTPTKVKYSKVSGLIKPVFDILGILPGYREQDISLWFFLFFILFFAMIIGDGGYGLLILIGTIALNIKMKKGNNVTFLLYVLSIATIIWGAVTGTWFGIEKAMEVPFLKALVIPGFANYPEYFNVTASAQQNNIMKFSFSIGAVQMVLGSILAIKKKITEKDLSWLANLGWVIAIIAMYLLALFLVIGENIPIVPVFGAIGVAFLLVILFGGMAPDKTFSQGLKSGLGGAFTAFLDTISCFGNVMSYIRLFAVGMAGLAISQSFNDIASGFKGPMVIAGVIVVIIGHALNLVMCFLSVVVHGVRLNVLEFSGQVGLEWTGIPYEPFKENEKIQN